MKRKLLSAMLVSALAFAIPAATLAAPAAPKTHEMKAEVVSIDEKAKTITLKDEAGESHTAPLMGKALDDAKSLKAGDKVTATCKDKETGEHEGVVDLKKV